MKLKIFTDGGARGNPGPAGAGAVIYGEDGAVLAKLKKFLGTKTNNQAEYEAVVMAVEKAAEMGARELKFFLDSELVVKQLNGQYKIKNPGIAPLAQRVLSMTRNFANVTFSHVPREKNQVADKLVNEVIDESV